MTGLEQLIDSGVLACDVPLGPLTTYKAGGPARYVATIGSRDDLSDLVASGVTDGAPILVLGRGSNLVVADTGFAGVVIRLGGAFSHVSVAGVEVEAGGAAPLARVARASVDAGVLGLEFFVGIPGSVGGAVRQNAGCFGTETVDRLESAIVVDLHSGEERQASGSDLDLSYRHSNLEPHQIVVEARFHGYAGDPAEGRALIREITRWRRDNQPGGTLNAGSVFKNPSEGPAGELIDRLGLKGTRVGDVAVSDKHANFFVAGPDATAADIRRLVEVVKDAVFEATGTILEPEIQFVGFNE